MYEGINKPARVFSVLIGYHVYPLNVILFIFFGCKKEPSLRHRLVENMDKVCYLKGQVSRGTANKQGLGMFDLITYIRQRHELPFIFNTHDSCK